MLCNHCNNKEATFHCKTVTNGKTTEMHLCSECAHELGFAEKYSDIFGDGMNVNSILNQFFALSGKKPSENNISGSHFPLGSTGIISLGEGYFYIADSFAKDSGHGGVIELYKLDRKNLSFIKVASDN